MHPFLQCVRCQMLATERIIGINALIWCAALCLAFAVGKTEAPQDVEVLIVGAGPGGLQWASLLEEANFTDYIVLEKGHGAGTFFRTYPRSRRLISNNKCRVGRGKTRDFSLRHDWNSLLGTNLSLCDLTSQFYAHADMLVQYLVNVAAALRVEYNAEVLGITRSSNRHVVHVADGRTWSCRHLVVATGLGPEPLPKEFLQELVSKRQSDVYSYANFPELDSTGRAPFCEDRDIFIVGNGNAAFETANLLAACAARVHTVFRRPPRFSALTHYVGDVRMKSFEIADRYLLKSLDSIIHLPGRSVGNMWHAIIAQNVMEFDGVLIFCGGFAGTQLAQRSELSPLVSRMNASARGKFPEVSTYFSDPVDENKWYAGNLMHGRDYRSGAGGFIHGFRYAINAQVKYVLAKHYDRPFPRMHFQASKGSEHNGALISHIISRYQNSSALYQMHGHIRDVVVLNPDGDGFLYIEEVPRYWVHETLELAGLGRPRCHCEVGFDYGHTKKVPGAWEFDFMFAEEREDQTPPLFLHPVIVAVDDIGAQKHYHGGEDFRAEWTSKEEVKLNTKAVRSCLTNCLVGASKKQTDLCGDAHECDSGIS